MATTLSSDEAALGCRVGRSPRRSLSRSAQRSPSGPGQLAESACAAARSRPPSARSSRAPPPVSSRPTVAGPWLELRRVFLLDRMGEQQLLHNPDCSRWSLTGVLVPVERAVPFLEGRGDRALGSPAFGQIEPDEEQAARVVDLAVLFALHQLTRPTSDATLVQPDRRLGTTVIGSPPLGPSRFGQFGAGRACGGLCLQLLDGPRGRRPRLRVRVQVDRAPLWCVPRQPKFPKVRMSSGSPSSRIRLTIGQ